MPQNCVFKCEVFFGLLMTIVTVNYCFPHCALLLINLISIFRISVADQNNDVNLFDCGL